MFRLLLDHWHALGDLPHLRLYLTLGWLLYLVGLGGWIVLQKREPVATLSWLISLAALPYVGFLVYYVLGPQRIHRQRLRRGRSRAALPPPVPGHDPSGEAIELARLGQASTGLPPASATAVALLVDGAATFDALFAAVVDAREHVHLEYYIYEPDHTGAALRDLLVERARAGVQVRLLLDAVGASSVGRAFLQPLLDAGGQVGWFHPMRLPRLGRRPWVNLRTHRKIVVIDNAVGFTGGINITDEQDERRCASAYRDLHLRLEGEVVQGLQQLFIEDWAYATGTAPLQLAHGHAPQGRVAAQVLASGPDSRWEAILRVYVGAIHAARTRVWLVTPYFVPGEAAMMALTSAALGGLDVRLVLPKRSDSRIVTYAGRSYFDELLAAGVKIHEYGPRLLHSKALLCDDDLAIVGSTNFDHRSFRLNFEVSVLFRDHTVAGALARYIEEQLPHAPRVRDRPNRSLRSRLPEALARLVSPLL